MDNYGSIFKVGQRLIITSGRFEGFEGKVVGFFKSTQKDTNDILSGVIISNGTEEKQAYDYRCVKCNITVTSIIKSVQHGYDAYVTTKNGNRYYINWATEPTISQVIKAWNEDKKWFIHIN
jgi:hypothetical protein